MRDDRRRNSQQNLFGEPEPRRSRSGVGPAEPTEAITELAERLPRGLFLGTSSWSFPGWEGLIYDRSASKTTLARKGLAAYARHPLFRSVGLDRTYYAPLTAEQLAALQTRLRAAQE